MNQTTSNTRPYIIVLGNEKGGTGKSTVSMHVIVHLMRLGFKVSSIDLDARQGTLTRYIENRTTFCTSSNTKLPTPTHIGLLKSTNLNITESEAEDKKAFENCINDFSSSDFIVIDTPGTDSYLSRLAHSYADTLITPLNDSFIDMDMLARVNPENGAIIRPSTYSEMVWEQKKQKAIRGEKAFDWIVMRNRLSSIYAKNKEEMKLALEALAKRVGFRIASGFGERVIFRELFLKGLTVLDLADAGIDMSLSHVAARQELRELLKGIDLPQIQQSLEKAA